MANNKLSDLNNHLFVALERLNDEDLKEDELKAEQSRAMAISKMATAIINNAKVTLSAMKLMSDGNILPTEMPEIIGLKANKNEDTGKQID